MAAPTPLFQGLLECSGSCPSCALTQPGRTGVWLGGVHLSTCPREGCKASHLLSWLWNQLAPPNTLPGPPWACRLCGGGRWLWDSPLLAQPLLHCVVWVIPLYLPASSGMLLGLEVILVRACTQFLAPNTHWPVLTFCCDSAAFRPSCYSACGVLVQNAY